MIFRKLGFPIVVPPHLSYLALMETRINEYVTAHANVLRALRKTDSFADVMWFIVYDMDIKFTPNCKTIIEALKTIGVK